MQKKVFSKTRSTFLCDAWDDHETVGVPAPEPQPPAEED